MFEIDLSDSITDFPCSDCGEDAANAWGWVHEGKEALAAYFAGLLKPHKERPVMLTLSIGQWGEGAAPDDRRMLLIELRPKGDSWAMMVRNATESRYRDELVLGVPMSREEALAWEGLEAAYAVADFIVAHDPAVRSFLRSGKIDRSGRDGK